MFAACRARNLVLKDEFLHLFVGPAVNGTKRLIICAVSSFVCFRDRDLILVAIILDQLVCAESFMAFLAVHQRIRERAKMTGCDPGLRIHEDCAVKTHVVWILLNKFLPPCFFYVILQLNAEITVIPCICKSAVDLGTRKNKSSGFRKRYNFIHRLFHNAQNSPLFICI